MAEYGIMFVSDRVLWVLVGYVGFMGSGRRFVVLWVLRGFETNCRWMVMLLSVIPSLVALG